MLTRMKILALGLERLGKSEEVEESHDLVGREVEKKAPQWNATHLSP